MLLLWIEFRFVTVAIMTSRGVVDSVRRFYDLMGIMSVVTSRWARAVCVSSYMITIAIKQPFLLR
jgi:hypothetical protein